eukprot:3543614-Prymnesium_polylepis.1
MYGRARVGRSLMYADGPPRACVSAARHARVDRQATHVDLGRSAVALPPAPTSREASGDGSRMPSLARAIAWGI